MTMNSKQDNFHTEDFKVCAKTAFMMKVVRAETIVKEVEKSILVTEILLMKRVFKLRCRSKFGRLIRRSARVGRFEGIIC